MSLPLCASALCIFIQADFNINITSMAHHHSAIIKDHSFSHLDDSSEIIDFSQLETEDDLSNSVEPKSEEGQDDDESEHGMSNLFDTEDPTRKLQYPLINKSDPPKGLPVHCKSLLWFQWPWYVWLRSQFLASESDKLQCAAFRGYLSVHNDRYCHVLQFPYMIHPYSNFALVWCVFVGICTALILVYAPYMIAFQPVRFYNLPPFPVLGIVGNVLLLLDTILRFCTGTVDPYSREVILDPRRVATRYLTGWFTFDILSRFPWDFVLVLQLSVDDREVKSKLAYIQILSFTLRVLRYRSVYDLLNRLGSIFTFRSFFCEWILKLLVLFLFTLHWLACLHWLLPNVFHVPSSPKPYSWVTQYELWAKPLWIQYINCYLRSLANLLTLDGGSYIPREPEEILCTSIGIVLWLTLFGYFISGFSIILSETNAAEEQYGEMLELLEGYFVFQKVPESCRERVLLYFEKRYRKHVFSDAVLLATISPSLRTEVMSHNCRVLVQRVSIFKNLPPSVIANISNILKYEVFVPGDILIAPNTVGDCMYFIQDGEVDILSSFGTLVTTLTDGHFFGEISLITGEKRMKTAIAKTVCEIYILTKENFDKCVASCPEVYKSILEVAQDRLEAEFKANLDAAKKQEDFKDWKKARKQLDKQIEEENKYVVDSSGIHFVGDNAPSSSDLGTDDDDDYESSTSTVYSRSISSQRSRLTGAISPTKSTKLAAKSRPNKIKKILDNVKGLTNVIKKTTKKKKK